MKEADILARTYYHRARVTRPEDQKQGVFDAFTPVVVYEDLPCAVSFSKGSTLGPTDTVQPIDYIAILFVRPEIDIQPGDEVVADVYGRVYRFKAGEGAVYASHCEVPLMRSDIA